MMRAAEPPTVGRLRLSGDHGRTQKGQVTIPKELRDALGIGAGTEVEFERQDDTIVVRKSDSQPSRGRQLAERLRGRGDVSMTTDEILALMRGS